MKNNQSALGLAVILWFVIIKSQNYFLLWARKQQQEPWSLDNYGVASPLHAIPAPMAKSCAMLIRIPKSEFLLNFNTTTGGISRVYWGYTPCILRVYWGFTWGFTGFTSFTSLFCYYPKYILQTPILK